MKTALVRLLFSFVFLTLTKFAIAGDFVSMVLQANQPLSIAVSSDRFLVIRNFTQEVGATNRGFVSVMKDGLTTNNAFSATIVDPAAPGGTLEVVNNFVVAGPATVTVTCGDTTSCFITYRKGDD